MAQWTTRHCCEITIATTALFDRQLPTFDVGRPFHPFEGPIRYCDGYGGPVIRLQTCCASSGCQNTCSKQGTPCSTAKLHRRSEFRNWHARSWYDWFLLFIYFTFKTFLGLLLRVITYKLKSQCVAQQKYQSCLISVCLQHWQCVIVCIHSMLASSPPTLLLFVQAGIHSMGHTLWATVYTLLETHNQSLEQHQGQL